jgi:hypothetical protein
MNGSSNDWDAELEDAIENVEGVYAEDDLPSCRADEVDAPDGAPAERIPDLNAIAPRLCVAAHGTVQEAIDDAFANCNIHKVAASGFKIFDVGATLKTTVLEQSGARHIFVPKYINFALRQPPRNVWKKHHSRDESFEANEMALDMLPNLSELYQILGRGFVDMGDVRLPSQWKLNLLSRQHTLKYAKLYGNCELLLSRFKNESLEGRKLALGSLLENIEDTPYGDIAQKWLGRKDDKKYASKELMAVATLWHLLSMDVVTYPSQPPLALDDGELGEWPFHKMRDCLEGAHMPTSRADLTPKENAMEQRCAALRTNDFALDRLETPATDRSPNGLSWSDQ